jgi:hypothetical protein
MSKSMFDKMMEDKEAKERQERHIQEIAEGTYRALEKERRYQRRQEEREAADAEQEAAKKEARERAWDMLRSFFDSKGFGGDGFKNLPELEFQSAYAEFDARVRRKQREIKSAILRNSLKRNIITIIAVVAIPYIAGLVGLDLFSTLFWFLDCVLIPSMILKTMFFRRGNERQGRDLMAYKEALRLAKLVRKKLEDDRAGKVEPSRELSI